MFKNSTVARTGRGAILAIATIVASTAAWAQDSIDYDHMLAVAETQTMVTQRMSAEALFIALDIDRELSRGYLDGSRNEFDRALIGFRDGDPGLRLSAIVDAELIGFVEDAERHWAEMDAVLAESLSGTAVTTAHVRALADSSESLQEEFEDLTEGLRERSKIRGSYSILGVALQTTNRISLLSQQMTKEFLLVAIGHQPGRYRSALRETAQDFQSGLLGLIEGDIDRLLLAAPTPDIRAQLQRVRQIWQDDYRPLIERAVSEGDLNDGAVARMAQINLGFLHEIEIVAHLYRQL